MEKKLRVLSVFGTRPEAVKMAPVVQALEQEPAIDSRVCVTAQHREMLDQVLDLFHIQPDIDLNLMQPDQSLTQLTSQILEHLEPVLKKEAPDWVLVQGDTTTVMATALACFYQGIHVGHVEAGLRTGDKHQPFPEEINRRLAGVMADLHFAPTDHARRNLLAEGVEEWRIKLTGNPVIDALNQISETPIPGEVSRWLKAWGVTSGGKRLVLVTAHRRENQGAPIEQICAALRELAEKYSGRISIVYPVHLNPRIQEPVRRLLDGVPGVVLLEPLEYLSLVHLERQAAIVLTDSGGIQEEAPAFGKPTLVLRDKTERPEGVASGVLRLVGTDPRRIVAEASRLLDDPVAYNEMAHAANPFGDGHASERIVKALLEFQEPPASDR
jgi:UDP-N-acetylglucosamine 2-epimerase (non-hydrolysing)